MHPSHPVQFRKSSYSANASDCVEVADLPSASLIRDTQNRQAGHLPFPGPEWNALLTAVRTDQA